MFARAAGSFSALAIQKCSWPIFRTCPAHENHVHLWRAPIVRNHARTPRVASSAQRASIALRHVCAVAPWPVRSMSRCGGETSAR